MNRRKINIRYLTVLCVTAVFFIAFAVMLYYTQVVNGESYSTAKTTVSSYEVDIAAARGEILDKNGNALVYNEQVNTLVFDYLDFPSDTKQRNEIILSLINFLESKNETWLDTLPLCYDGSGIIMFRENRDADIAWLKSSDMLNMNPYATAANCIDGLIERYELQDYSQADAIKIASVCYGMKKLGFSASAPYTFAQGVSIQTIAYIKENGDFYKGVDAQVTSERKYVGDGTLASHILGVVGAIDADEYAEKKEKTQSALSKADVTDDEKLAITAKAYSLNDKIGKNGIESAMEDYLRGTKGTKIISVNSDDEIFEKYSVAPQTGNTVVLTIDQNLQEIAEASLKKRIGEVTEDIAIQSGLTPAGAVVVEDVNSGAVLASASYPNYSLTTYYDNYETLSKSSGNPLWNRAFQNTYSPGSTMKPVIAIAALEEGVINGDSTYYCTGQYDYFDQHFVCFNKNAHGTVNVKTALKVSCNIFFFEMARQLGIDKMNTYSSLFGLGQKTGIEIAESAGILAGISYRDSIGATWNSGETLLAAIGQSDNSFTPIQLVNYCATIANGGTRYVPYLVSKVLSSDYSETVYERKPQVAAQTNVAKTTIDTVKQGMYLVANEASSSLYLGNLKYKVAAKTGTAEKTVLVNGRYYEGTDGFLITFGPYDDAQIAITVVIENAGSGSSTAQVAADIYNYYFSNMGKVNSVQNENELL